jgi:hypothetical protein
METKDQEAAQANRPAEVEARREDARAAFGSAGSSASETRSSMNREAGEYGGARGAMQDAVSTTEGIGRDVVGGAGNIATGVVSVVADTANTVIDGVGSVGENVIHTAADLLTEVVSGVRQVVGSAFRGVGSTGRPYPGQEMSRGDAASRREEARRRETSVEEAAH